jgi:hypothetical protein
MLATPQYLKRQIIFGKSACVDDAVVEWSDWRL